MTKTPAARGARDRAARAWGVRLALAGTCLTVPALASADLVELTNGRVLSVDSCRVDGDVAVIVLRDGAQMQIARTSIAGVEPDEMPYPKPVDPATAPVAPSDGTRTVESLRSLVDQMAARVGVDVKLARAVVRTESNYDPRAVSSKGAMGLMQLMPDVAKQYGVDDPFDPVKNL